MDDQYRTGDDVRGYRVPGVVLTVLVALVVLGLTLLVRGFGPADATPPPAPSPPASAEVAAAEPVRR